MKYILIVGLLSSCAYAGDVLTFESNIFYDVKGQSVRSLWRSICRNSPEDAAGKCDYHVQWHYGESRKKFSAFVTVAFTYPRLSEPIRDKAVEAKWSAYMKALVEHERKHMKIAQEAVRRMRKRVAGLTDKQEIYRICREVMKKCHEVQDRFDKKTNHGATDGARLK